MELDLNLITSHMDELKDTEARLKFELNNVQKEIEKEELKLTALIEQEGVNSMDYGIYTVLKLFSLKPVIRMALPVLISAFANRTLSVHNFASAGNIQNEKPSTKNYLVLNILICMKNIKLKSVSEQRALPV